MSTNGTFEIEDSDIVRLDGRLDGESAARSRLGWVNVGAFALRIELSEDGDLNVCAYALGHELTDNGLAEFSVRLASAMAAGATDPDQADPGADTAGLFGDLANDATDDEQVMRWARLVHPDLDLDELLAIGKDELRGQYKRAREAARLDAESDAHAASVAKDGR